MALNPTCCNPEREDSAAGVVKFSSSVQAESFLSQVLGDRGRQTGVQS